MQSIASRLKFYLKLGVFVKDSLLQILGRTLLQTCGLFIILKFNSLTFWKPMNVEFGSGRLLKLKQTIDFAFFVEFELGVFRLAHSKDLRKSRIFNSDMCLYSEYWECPRRLGKNVVGFAKNNRTLLKYGRKTFRSTKPKIRNAINEAKWVTYKPILTSLLGVQPYSTLNQGPISFGCTEIEFCPVKAAKYGIRRGIHPDALFAGKIGVKKIKQLAKEGDTILFFNENFEERRDIVSKDFESTL